MRPKIKKRRNVVKTFLKISSLVAIVIVSFWLYRYLFIVKKINCVVLPENDCDQVTVVELSNLNGSNLINLSTQNIKQKIMGAYPNIVGIDFLPKLPGTIDINITKTQPIARIAQSSSSAVLAIQDNGYLANIDQEVVANLPIIYYENLNYQDESVRIDDKTLLLVTDLIKIFSNYFIPIDQVDIKVDNSAYVKLNSGPIAIFDLFADLRAQVESLQLITSKTSSELPIKTIDIRLTKPIITTGESD